MGVAKRIVFPILRLVLWAIIAVALVVIAVKPSGLGTSENETFEPGANFAYSTIMPIRGEVSNTVRLSGQIVPDASVEVKATSAGVVHRLWVGSGDTVESGAPLIVLRQPLGDGTDENLYTTTTIWANTSGRVSIDVSRGEEITLDQVVGKISSDTFVVEAEIEAHQMYSLVSAPGTAAVTITNGPPEFTCTGFTTSIVDGEDGLGTKARCFVPADVLVFPGLSAAIEIVTESVTDVLLVPVTAVEGIIGQGKVWRLTPEGETEEVEVSLGLTDGESIEITSGLSESDEILMYALGTPEEQMGWGPFPGEYLEEEFIDDDGFEG